MKKVKPEELDQMMAMATMGALVHKGIVLEAFIELLDKTFSKLGKDVKLHINRMVFDEYQKEKSSMEASDRKYLEKILGFLHIRRQADAWI